MSEGLRARAEQVAERVNAAAGLLEAGSEVLDVVRELAGRYGLSERQARRYVERARRHGPVELPTTKIVFTVKLPAVLARRVRDTARSTGQSISSLVGQALSEFLDRHHGGAG